MATVEDLTAGLKSRFQQMAKEAGWPEEVYTNVDLVITESGIEFLYQGEDMEGRVFDLEYGKFRQSPRAAIRNFKSREKNTIYSAALLVNLAKAGLI